MSLISNFGIYLDNVVSDIDPLAISGPSCISQFSYFYNRIPDAANFKRSEHYLAQAYLVLEVKVQDQAAPLGWLLL